MVEHQLVLHVATFINSLRLLFTDVLEKMPDFKAHHTYLDMYVPAL